MADSQLRIEAVGNPSYAASVSLSPSLSVNIRRGSLLALQGDSANVSIKPLYLNVLKRFLYGNLSSRYTQIVSTEPAQLLVSAKAETALPWIFRVANPKAIAALELDGKSDWALFKRDALQLFGGPSLTVETVKVPQRISRQLAKTLKLRTRIDTGLFSWLRPGYTFVGGRGIIGVLGNCQIYSVVVAEGEEAAFNKSCMVGLSVNGPKDLQNCVVKFDQAPVHVPAVIIPPPRVKQIQSWSDFVINLKHYSWIAAKSLKDAYFFVRRHTSETPGFVKVIGPRTVLLQSGVPHDQYEKTFALPSLESYGTVVPSQDKEFSRKPADYLNNVYVGPKGVTIESTESFVEKKDK